MRTTRSNVRGMSLPGVGASRFVGVTIDAVDVETVGSFWAAALRGTLVETQPDRWQVQTSRRHAVSEVIWINAVDHPRAVKSRAHFDLRLGSQTPDALLRAGAQVLRSPGRDPWYVLADPEGNAFCAYPSEPDRSAGIFELVVDSADPHAQASWWAAVLGGRVAEEGSAAAVTDTPSLPWDFLVFDAVPEPKIGRNRLRWHVELAQPDPAGLIAAGATVIGASRRGQDLAWEMADPEGNEFWAHAAGAHR